MTSGISDPERLLRSLAPELFRTEILAARHCHREARRVPATPPAAALLAVAAHVEVALRELNEIARTLTLPRSSLAALLGNLVSAARERLTCRTMPGDRSFRGTLHEMRHGVDIVHMLALTARDAGYGALDSWAQAWLQRREPLVQEVGRQLAWFAVHRALARANVERWTPVSVAKPDCLSGAGEPRPRVR